MSVSKKILVLSSLLALGAGMSASAAPRINGAGASFPAKIYQRWFAELARSGGPQVNYQSVVSCSGRKTFIDQTVNFAASDDPMKKKDMAKVGRGVVQIPLVVGRSRVVRNAVDVELGGIGAGGQKAQGGRSHQQLLEKFH